MGKSIKFCGETYGYMGERVDYHGATVNVYERGGMRVSCIGNDGRAPGKWFTVRLEFVSDFGSIVCGQGKALREAKRKAERAAVAHFERLGVALGYEVTS